jgi:rhodanese-related sulfurtransferase
VSQTMISISPKTLHEKLSAGVALRLIDVRTPVEFATAHVGKAVSKPLENLRPAELARECSGFAGEIYVICQSGVRACKAISQLEAAGYYECAQVEGGMAAWMADGLPVERQTTGVITLERQVRIAAGFLVFAGTLLGVFVHPLILAIPGLVGAGLIFAGVSDTCGMAMLLARMPWNQTGGNANSTCGCPK